MSKARTAARLIFGLLLVIFSLNFFFHFIPQPTPPEQAMKYMAGLMAAPYFFPVLKVTELLVGILLLANVAVPLALVLIAPIVVQIFLYHTILDPSGAPLAILLVVLEAFLGFAYFNYYRPLFKRAA